MYHMYLVITPVLVCISLAISVTVLLWSGFVALVTYVDGGKGTLFPKPFASISHAGAEWKRSWTWHGKIMHERKNNNIGKVLISYLLPFALPFLTVVWPITLVLVSVFWGGVVVISPMFSDEHEANKNMESDPDE